MSGSSWKGREKEGARGLPRRKPSKLASPVPGHAPAAPPLTRSPNLPRSTDTRDGLLSAGPSGQAPAKTRGRVVLISSIFPSASATQRYVALQIPQAAPERRHQPGRQRRVLGLPQPDQRRPVAASSFLSVFHRHGRHRENCSREYGVNMVYSWHWCVFTPYSRHIHGNLRA